MRLFLLGTSIFFLLFVSDGHQLEASLEKGHIATDRQEMLVGTIQSVHRNNIVIINEDTKLPVEFVYLGRKIKLAKGDKVRIYYRRRGQIIDIIKKLTPVEYKADGQNKGYFLKKD